MVSYNFENIDFRTELKMRQKDRSRTPTCYAAACLILVLVLLGSTKLTYIYAYPASASYIVPAKWADLYFSICIFNSGDSKYEKLFVDAVETWKNVWPHFSYKVSEGRAGCDIDLNIVKYPVGLAKERGSYGTTKVEYLESRGSITSVDMIIPTQTKKEVYQGDYCCKEVVDNISDKVFYITALHEFGHALGLGHTKDDGKGSLDIMHPNLYQQSDYLISSVTIKGLDDLYGTSTEAVDHAVTIKPDVVLEAKTNKDRYVSGETVSVHGKVSNLGGKGIVMLFTAGPEVSIDLLLYNPSYMLELCRPEFCYNFEPNSDGSFNLDIDIDKSGRFGLLMQYQDVSKILMFDVHDSAIPEDMREAMMKLQLNAWQRAELENAFSNMDNLTIIQKLLLEMVRSSIEK